MANGHSRKKSKQRKDGKLIAYAAKRIRMVRKANGITQEQLEDKTGIKISRCESGKYDMTLTTLGILSRHLGVEPWQLLK
ncbi:MAG: helix-turn-helix transcriptional regulator [Bacteroidetes bacterium]|nr:helix-turn-helix transcriptional regulator [Bacteroidota bacterium]